MTTNVYNMTYSAILGASRADLSTESSIGQPPLAARGQSSPGLLGRSRYRRSRALVRGLLAATVLAVASACQLFTHPHDLDTDVVVLSLLLESGERTAKMVARHPHREWDEAPPDIGATLEGPGWTVEFSATLPTWEECGFDYVRYGSDICLIAQLPEAVAPGVYRIRGTGPLGSFAGEATVPAMPSPGVETLRVPVPAAADLVFIPLDSLDYQVDSATAALLLDIVVGPPWAPTRSFFSELGDSVPWEYPWLDRDLATDLWARALGHSYTAWFRRTGGELLLPPWPSFGIEGEGVYGYFDGISPRSRRVHIVGDPQ